jgi:hypothetical protein
MIPKDTYSNLYLGLYQAEIEKAGRTVRGSASDYPATPGGPSVRVVGRRGGTRCSTVNNGPSTHLADRPLGHRGLSTRAARRWVLGCEEISLLPSFLFPKPQEVFIPLSFLLSLKEKAPSLGILIRALPGPSEHIPGLSARFSTMSSRYFFAYLILSLGF